MLPLKHIYRCQISSEDQKAFGRNGGKLSAISYVFVLRYLFSTGRKIGREALLLLYLVGQCVTHQGYAEMKGAHLTWKSGHQSLGNMGRAEKHRILQMQKKWVFFKIGHYPKAFIEDPCAKCSKDEELKIWKSVVFSILTVISSKSFLFSSWKILGSECRKIKWTLFRYFLCELGQAWK